MTDDDGQRCGVCSYWQEWKLIVNGVPGGSCDAPIADSLDFYDRDLMAANEGKTCPLFKARTESKG